MAVVPVLGPFSWEQLLASLASFPPMSRFAANDDGTVRLRFRLDRTWEAVSASVRFAGDALHIDAEGADEDAIAAEVARILSVDCDARSYPDVGVRDAEVGRLMEALPGLRPLNFPSPYECAVWAVLSQRISMRQAQTLQRRLIDEHGDDGCMPHPATLLDLRELPGLPAVKVERLRGVGAAALQGALDVARLVELGEAEGPRSLLGIPGIGPFWSLGIWLRGCGIHDVFPDEPLSIAALGVLHGLGTRPSAEAVRELTDVYRPWRMWVCSLLRVAAGRAGLIPGIQGHEMAIRRGR